MNRLVIRATSSILKPVPFISAGRHGLRTSSIGRIDHKDDFKPSEELLRERYESRLGEDLNRKRARLLYQSRKRGMLENGVILASFADKFLHKMEPEELDQYDQLINLPTNDWDIYYWATKTKPTPPEFETPVMEKLRQHINSKVSNESIDVGKIFKKRPYEIAVRSKHPGRGLSFDPYQVSLVDYEDELFDDSVKSLKGGNSMANMMPWRKSQIVRRLRRVIAAPISLRHLSDNKQTEVYSQKIEETNIGTGIIAGESSLDTPRQRSLNHHRFVQYLFGRRFTKDVSEYDQEAEAWAEIQWHRNYGSGDITLNPSSVPCSGCSAKLQCCDPGMDGYLPRVLFSKLFSQKSDKTRIKCQRCKFFEAYGVKLSQDVSKDDFLRLLSNLNCKEPSIVCILVDLVDFPASLWEGLIDLIGTHHKIIVAGNKLDLLPNDGPRMIQRVTEVFKRNLNRLRLGEKNLFIQDAVVMSARTGFGVDSLISRILQQMKSGPKDVYLVGASNSGKSTLFNALLQSDLSAIRKGDLLNRISVFNFPSIQDKMLRFPVDNLESWQLMMRLRRTVRVERNFAAQERSLESTTRIRQATVPHMSMLIDRTEYEAIAEQGKLRLLADRRGQRAEDRDKEREANAAEEGIENEEGNDDDGNKDDEEQGKNTMEEEVLPNYCQDHPFQKISKGKPFSVSPSKYPRHGFLHLLPSARTEHELSEMLDPEERLQALPGHRTIEPRKYSIRPLQSILIAGLARLDLLTAQSNVIFTIFVSKHLPIHVIPTRKADQFYNEFLGSPYLGPPFGEERRLASWPGLRAQPGPDFVVHGSSEGAAMDIVLSSLGWALVRPRLDQECWVRAHTAGGAPIWTRNPPLLASHKQVRKFGKKVRDTPMFQKPGFTIERSKEEPQRRWSRERL